MEGTKQLDLSEQYRVFCQKHDIHAARYCDGRPLLDDSCPECQRQEAMTILRKILETPYLENGRLYTHNDIMQDVRSALLALTK